MVSALLILVLRRSLLASLAILLCFCPPRAASLQIGPLLSTCVDACQRGCAEIRAVQSKRADTNSNSDLNIQLKDSANSKSALTEADCAAQAAICGALRAEWGDALHIVGEEDDDDDTSSPMAQRIAALMPFDPLDRTLFEDDIGTETPDISVEEITIYVDPLDATREFVEGRLENCQSLVGIAVGSEAVAGCIGIPFPGGDLSTEPTIVYGLVDFGTGIMGEPLTRGPYPLEKHIDGIKFPRPHFASGDATTPEMEATRAALVKGFGGSNVLYGGAGNKILAASLGEVSAAIQPRFGGAWDLCAPEAILRAMGGHITDFFGETIALYGKDANSGANKRGYVATASTPDIDHDALIAMMLAIPEVQEYRESLE